MALSPNDHDLAVARPWSPSARSGKALLLVLLPALLLLEWTAGNAFSLYLFYLVPVSLAAWTFGYRAGFAIAAVSAAYCIFVALAAHPANAPLGLLLWQSVSTLTLFMLFSFVVAHHRSFIDKAVLLARVDVESGALSRREFERLLDAEARRARRYRRPLSLVLVDAGAEGGASRGFAADVGEALLKNVRECDCVARIGKRRFALLLVECPETEASHVVARTRELLEHNFERRNVFRFGAVTYGGSSATTPAQLLHLAQAQVSSARVGAAPGIAQVQVA